MSEDQELFDRSLLRRRRARFAGETAEHEFLLSHVAAEIAERIGAILRDFPLALDLGAYHGLLGRAVAALPSVGDMIYAESVPSLATRCPRPAVVCDEERLPFKEMSLSLVVSGLALHRVNDLPGALIQIRRSLRPDGLFMGAALGTRSLQELRQVLKAEAELHGGASPRVAPFADVREYGALLQRAGFALPVTDAELLTVTYPSPRDRCARSGRSAAATSWRRGGRRHCRAARSNARKTSTVPVTARLTAEPLRASRLSFDGYGPRMKANKSLWRLGVRHGVRRRAAHHRTFRRRQGRLSGGHAAQEQARLTRLSNR